VAGVRTVGEVLVGIIAVQHLLFFYLEAVLWTTPRGRAIFGTTVEQAEQSAALAKNQGLYNGFLAAALIWGLVAAGDVAFQFQVYGLACVIVAGGFGAATVSRRILFVQAVPAAVGLVLVLAGGH
jgi:putative membrane protein